MVGSEGMFEHLKEFPVILVTGPQRSGTRICAKMIAHDTGHRFVDEAEIHTDSLYELVLQMHFAEERGQKIVVQCPALCHDVIHFKPYNPAIVMMIRNIDDIHASERRIGWWFNDLEAIKYWDWTEQERPMGDIARLKYDYWWLVCQEWKEDSWFEVEYESLSAHPLWIPKEERGDFNAWQTEVE